MQQREMIDQSYLWDQDQVRQSTDRKSIRRSTNNDKDDEDSKEDSADQAAKQEFTGLQSYFTAGYEQNLDAAI